MSEHIHYVTDANFEAEVLQSATPVLVDYWAEWCGPCKMIAPQFASAAAQSKGRVAFGKVDTERHPQLSARFGIRSIPTMVLFRGGREVARVSGAMSAADLLRWVGQAGRTVA